VIVGQEVLPIIHEVVIHLCPDVVFLGHSGIDFEGNKGHSVGVRYSLEILVTEIRFICRHFLELKILGSPFQQWHKVRGIIRRPARHVHAGNNLGVHAAHEMDFHPLPVTHFSAIFLVKPAHKTARAEAR
jgi:hypothetical protein